MKIDITLVRFWSFWNMMSKKNALITTETDTLQNHDWDRHTTDQDTKSERHRLNTCKTRSRTDRHRDRETDTHRHTHVHLGLHTNTPKHWGFYRVHTFYSIPGLLIQVSVQAATNNYICHYQEVIIIRMICVLFETVLIIACMIIKLNWRKQKQ